jgi:SAM-dependent methyltransferase
MSLFSNPKKKLAHDVAQKLISGHTTLVSYWALKHAGVLDAMKKSPEGLEPVAFAQQTNMSEDTLQAILAYLQTQGLVEFKSDRAFRTQNCDALMEFDDGVLEHMRAYDGVTHAIEHLLARLKLYGSSIHRRSDVVMQAQSNRYTEEVYPAIESAAIKHNATHVLDLNCGPGTLLVRLALRAPKVVGVGVCEDGVLTRQANAAIANATLEKRLIAVNANPIEICTTTQRALDRVSVSQQLWEKFNCLIACGVFTDIAARDPLALIAALRQISVNFKSPTVLIAEPCSGPRFDKTYYAAEMTLLNRLARINLPTQDQWRNLLGEGQLKVLREVALETDGVTLFICSA